MKEKTIYRITTSEVVGVMEELGVESSKLTPTKIREIQKSFEGGMSDYWYDVLRESVREAFGVV